MRVRHLLAVLLALAALPAALARAESFAPPAGQSWVVVASTMDRDTAIGIARLQGADGRVVRTRNGWLAVTFGPLSGTLEAIKGERWPPLPPDALLADGTAFVETVWQPTDAVIAGAEVRPGAATRLRSGDMTVRFRRTTLESGWEAKLDVATAARGRSSLVHTFDGAADYPSNIYLIELDSSNTTPEVVFDAYSGGAHCCTQTIAAVEDAKGAWRLVDFGERDGEGLEFEDVDGDGAAEILEYDQSFLYAFDSYAGSVPPLRIASLKGDELVDITTSPVVRPRLVQYVRGLDFRAKVEPDLWTSSGFMAGWVASKILIGEGDEAWAHMLRMKPADAGFGPQECTSGGPVDSCPQANLRTLPFPEALKRHLAENGYVPVPKN